MIKYKKPDLVAILRLFNQADDQTGTRLVDQVKSYDVDDQSTLVSFRFSKSTYFLLTDHRAFDEADYIKNVISRYAAKVGGSLLINPTTTDSFGMPFKGKEVYLFKQSPEKVRLDKELSKRYPDLSRSTIQKYIKSGYVSVNSKTIESSRFEILAADDISLDRPDIPDHSKQSLPIIYIDDDVIVIEKPAGILTHSKGVLNDEFTVADFFRRYTSFNLDSSRPGIVHRLDRDTSGIMIGARHEDSADLLKTQFSNRSVNKTYQAIISGIPKNMNATIDVPIARSPSKPGTFIADAKGKAAVTDYRVDEFNDAYSRVILSPRTGRTHQLRVHMFFIGHPILGDRLYGKSSDRLYLHAEKLSLMIPSASEPRTFVSKLPDEFKKRMSK